MRRRNKLHLVSANNKCIWFERKIWRNEENCGIQEEYLESEIDQALN